MEDVNAMVAALISGVYSRMGLSRGLITSRFHVRQFNRDHIPVVIGKKS